MLYPRPRRAKLARIKVADGLTVKAPVRGTARASLGGLAPISIASPSS
jgi:hypothetical protein